MMSSRTLLLLTLACLALAFLLPWGDGGASPFGPSTGEVSILIVEETAERSSLPESQLAVLMSTAIREWAKTHCDKGPDGVPEFRILDKDADVSHMSQKFQDRFNKSKSMPVPNIAVSTGRSGAEGDLPLTEADVLDVLGRYAGK